MQWITGSCTFVVSGVVALAKDISLALIYNKSLLNNTSGSEGIPSVQIFWLIYNIHEEKNDRVISQQNNNVVMINH